MQKTKTIFRKYQNDVLCVFKNSFEKLETNKALNCNDKENELIGSENKNALDILERLK